VLVLSCTPPGHRASWEFCLPLLVKALVA